MPLSHEEIGRRILALPAAERDRAAEMYLTLYGAKKRPRASKRRSALDDALEAATEARALIPTEQAKLDAQIAVADDETRREHLRWQRDLVSWQLTQAADVAERRRAYLDGLKTDDDWAREFERCATDGGTLHWFRQWAWTLDPRGDSPLSVLPFDPFPFQADAIDWLERLVFEDRRMGCIEKSRDMGATWITVLWAIKHWRFRPYFQALFSSMKEEEVDHKQNAGTIFGKLRFAVKYLPPQMLPAGFVEREHSTFLHLANPENGSLVSGKAPTPDISRSERQTVIVADEFASWAFGGHPQHTAMSQTSRSVVAVSTPKGKQNKFYQLRSSPGMPVLRMYWTEHPWKDDRWRAGEPAARGMQPHQVAQEIELDYEASETGQRLKAFDPLVHVVTLTEFANVFGEIAYETVEVEGRRVRRPCIPKVGSMAVGLDWGDTPGHPTAIVYVWRPPESAPHHNKLFVVAEIVRPQWPDLPPDWTTPTPRALANEMFALETERGWRHMIRVRLMSPERKEERMCFRGEQNKLDTLPAHLRMPFEGWRARDDYGYPQLQTLLAVNYDHANPFRHYPGNFGEDDTALALLRGAPIPGDTGIYFVVADGEGEISSPDRKALNVTEAATEGGLRRTRAEIPAKRKEQTTSGEERAADKKIFDDAIDALRGALTRFGPKLDELSDEQRAAAEVEATKPQLTAPAIAKLDTQAQIMALMMKADEIQKATGRLRRKRAPKDYDPLGLGPDDRDRR